MNHSKDKARHFCPRTYQIYEVILIKRISVVKVALAYSRLIFPRVWSSCLYAPLAMWSE